jgi:N-acetylglucosaminyl-diphospho-decaprenol L-rhamnosyltransferase
MGQMPESSDTGLVQVQIVNYRREDLTLACLTSVRRQSYAHQRILLIDNGATPESQAALQQVLRDPGDMRLLANVENLGWGAAHNRGFRLKEGGTLPEFFLVVNNDAVLDPECLTELVKTMREDPRCAVASPMIYKDESRTKPDNVGFNLSYRYFLPLDWGYVLGNHRRYFLQGSRQVTWSDDTVALFRGKPLLEAGGYDEDYFMYVDETDLAYRLHQAGYSIRVNYRATAFHGGKGSSHGRVSVFSLHCKFKNWLRFHRKHFGVWHAPYIWLWLTCMFAVKSARLFSEGRFVDWTRLSKGLLAREGVRP